MATAAEAFSTEVVNLSLLSMAGEPRRLEVDDTRGSTTSTPSAISLFSPTDGTTTATLGSMLAVPSETPGFSHFPTGVADTMAIAVAVPEKQKSKLPHNVLKVYHFLHCTLCGLYIQKCLA